jgi:hypothetical protein
MCDIYAFHMIIGITGDYSNKQHYEVGFGDGLHVLREKKILNIAQIITKF